MTEGFLQRMAVASHQRVEDARSRRPEAELRARAHDLAEPPALRLSESGFDVIAEVKRASPSEGRLVETDDVVARVRSYAAAGAAAASILTEPSTFGGRLEDLHTASAAGVLPTMRKDFLVDPYQVLEARVAGASGVLVIIRMLSDQQFEDLLGMSASCGLFALVEAFDRADLERAERILRRAPVSPWFPGHSGPALGIAGSVPCLVGVNSRDLTTLDVDRRRFGELTSRFPPGFPRVAESGIADAADVRSVVGYGYRVALVGSALMRATDPAALVREMIRVGRSEQGGRRHAG